MKQVLRSLVLLAVFALAAPVFAQSQEDAILLVAHPAFRDLEYRQTVLIAAPAPGVLSALTRATNAPRENGPP